MDPRHDFILAGENHPAHDVLLDAATADVQPDVFTINTALRAVGAPHTLRVWELTDRKLHVQAGRHWQPLSDVASALLD
jgi:hypothetical protein